MNHLPLFKFRSWDQPGVVYDWVITKWISDIYVIFYCLRDIFACIEHKYFMQNTKLSMIMQYTESFYIDFVYCIIMDNFVFCILQYTRKPQVLYQTMNIKSSYL